VMSAVVACAFVSSACALDFTRYIPDASVDRALLPIDTPRMDQTVVWPDRGPIDEPFVIDRGPDIGRPDVLDIVDAVDIVDEPAPPCGDASQPCCSSGTTCIAGLACSTGTCVPCGSASQPCCDGTCSTGSTCVGTTCQSTCGAVGQTCCAGLCSNDMAICSSGTCAVCGSALQVCCASGCHAGLECVSSTGRCAGCGYYGEQCCSTGTPCTEGTCQATATSGMVCLGNPATNIAGGACSGTSRCSDNSFCDGDGFCSGCGGPGEPCCFTTDCRVGLACGPLTRCR
jgi:hypothetical protein